MIKKQSQVFRLRTFDANSDVPLRFLHETPNDPFFENDIQWHFKQIGNLGFNLNYVNNNSQGIEAVWQDFQGDLITVGIWDDGVQQSHWDLIANYDVSRQVTINGNLNDGQPLTNNDGHGTSVAGLIAADNNNMGGLGIAHDATITGIRIFGGADDINLNWERYLLTLDSLKNFDVTNHSYGGYPDFRVWSDISKFEAAAEQGRNGLGTINVKSAGNDNVDGNGDALDASRFTVTVAAIGNNNTGHVTSYSTYGAHILVSAPAAAVTTDLLGIAGYNGLQNGDYTNVFGGTSAAGPVTAGIIALMLDANPSLGWRDVQNILAFSSVGVGSLYTNNQANENSSWKWNAASNWNGGGLHYSEDYGYGLVNTFNAVRMAEAWGILKELPATSSNEVIVTTGTLTANRVIQDLRTINYNFTLDENIILEHATLDISLTHTYFTDLRIRLISPDGTSMTLFDGSTGDRSTSDYGLSYSFGLDGLRGTESAGIWTLQIQDIVRSDSGTLHTINFTGYGSASSNDDVYHYTDEILSVISLPGNSSRIILADDNGGIDWINASAISSDLILYLEYGKTSTLLGNSFLSIEAGSIIENALGGDGDDRIEGNEHNNLIYGLRGDDLLIGGDGHDIAGFRGDFTDYQISSSNGYTYINGFDGMDTITGFEILRFDDRDVIDPSAGIIPADMNAPILFLSSPEDNANNVSIDSDIILIFNEYVAAGSGFVNVYSSEGSLFESIEINSDRIIFRGEEVAINLNNSFAYDTSYYVLIDLGAIEDPSGNIFPGINLPTLLNFRTEMNLNYITGSSRGNRLTGTDRNDHIDGMAGNDTLNGKLGNDILIGGLGKDNFVFDTPIGSNNVDIISGFNSRDDTIRLENSIFTSFSRTGGLSTSFFRSNDLGIAVDHDDYIIFNTLNGNLYYDADGIGSIESIHFATISGIFGNLTHLDFIIF